MAGIDAGRARAAAAAQVLGGGVVPLGSDARVADRLMAGTLLLSPHAAVPLPAEPAWDADPFRDRNWCFQLHCLVWADPLRRQGERAGDAAMLDRHARLLASWVDANPRDDPPSEFSWADMATGRRTVALAAAVSTHGALPWLLDAVRTHGEVLADPDFGARAGNHALHVAMGLLVAGAVLDDDAWLDQGVARLEALTEASYDHEGVNLEGSVGYQGLNRRWTAEARSRVVAAGRPVPPVFDRPSLVPDLMRHATLPDGTFEAIGDTALTRTPRRLQDGEVAPGSDGVEPERHRVFAAGYLFARSGWGAGRPAADETFYSLRFGRGRAVENHGHEDQGALTLYAHGGRLLFDAGLYRYGGSARQRYVASRAAHCVVDVLGADYRDDVAARLLHVEHAPARDVATVCVTALAGTTWLRTVLYSRTGDFLLVDDRLRHTAPATSVQRWHLPTDRTVDVGRADVRTSGDGPNLLVHWLGEPPRLDVVEGQEDPLLGWRSPGYGGWVPSPVAQATRVGTEVAFTTLLVPVPPGQDAPDVVVTDVELGNVVRATVRIGDHVETVELDRLPVPEPEAPPARPRPEPAPVTRRGTTAGTPAVPATAQLRRIAGAVRRRVRRLL